MTKFFTTALNTVSPSSSNKDRDVAFCRGFRMPADRSDAACTVAGVRKPSMKEPAGNGRRWRRERRALWRFAHDGAA